jgi:hypothetical protein
MLELPVPSQRPDLGQLNQELEPLGLPTFVGVALLLRKQNPDGVWKPSEPYLLVKCGALTRVQRDAVEGVVDAHVAAPVIPPDPEEAPFTEAERKALRRAI